MGYKQEAPFAVQIELSEGCNLRCSFCGLNGIRQPKENDFKFMQAGTLRMIMEEIVRVGWNPRVEFAMHGEPTMHPDYVGMIQLARVIAPKLHLMMTSNGGGLLRKPGPVQNVCDLFRAGLNTLALDDYDGIKIVPKIRDAWNVHEFGENTGIVTYDYPREPKGSPHARRPVTQRTLVFIEDISKATEGNHSLLNNHAGAGAPKDDSQATARCAKPFREMSFRWDGNVAVCCNDWRGEYKCGNIGMNIEAVWNSKEMDAARRKLYHRQRDFGPCDGCNAVSYRVGLLPDKMGRDNMPVPNSRTAEIIRGALAGPPYTAPVLRPWEKK